jgi:hypothetical protein
MTDLQWQICLARTGSKIKMIFSSNKEISEAAPTPALREFMIKDHI